MYLILTEDGLVKLKPVPFKTSGKNKDIDIPKFVDYIQWYLGGEFEEVGTPLLEKKEIRNIRMLAGKRKASNVNLVASYIYGTGLHGNKIYGDVALIFEPIDHQLKERKMKPMDVEQVRVLLNEIKEIHDVYFPDNDEYDIWG